MHRVLGRAAFSLWVYMLQRRSPDGTTRVNERQWGIYRFVRLLERARISDDAYGATNTFMSSAAVFRRALRRLEAAGLVSEKPSKGRREVRGHYHQKVLTVPWDIDCMLRCLPLNGGVRKVADGTVTGPMTMDSDYYVSPPTMADVVALSEARMKRSRRQNVDQNADQNDEVKLQQLTGSGSISDLFLTKEIFNEHECLLDLNFYHRGQEPTAEGRTAPHPSPPSPQAPASGWEPDVLVEPLYDAGCPPPEAADDIGKDFPSLDPWEAAFSLRHRESAPAPETDTEHAVPPVSPRVIPPMSGAAPATLQAIFAQAEALEVKPAFRRMLPLAPRSYSALPRPAIPPPPPLPPGQPAIVDSRWLIEALRRSAEASGLRGVWLSDARLADGTPESRVLAAAAAALREQNLAPAQWAMWSCMQWISALTSDAARRVSGEKIREKPANPPLRWVWSATRIREQAEDCRLTHVVVNVGPPHPDAEAYARAERGFYAAIQHFPPDACADLDRAFFPGGSSEMFDRAAAAIEWDNGALRDRVAKGEWVWGMKKKTKPVSRKARA